ncbi:hypothetical protein TWF730_007354 [Orbilia blumenaviensis]|uniref:Uncharacterized protein n=1 Tax=Orbilia blumenaviensis TaxID=1796055 RepID=A0AAV9VDZ4_9PEZI
MPERNCIRDKGQKSDTLAMDEYQEIFSDANIEEEGNETEKPNLAETSQSQPKSSTPRSTDCKKCKRRETIQKPIYAYPEVLRTINRLGIFFMITLYLIVQGIDLNDALTTGVIGVVSTATRALTLIYSIFVEGPGAAARNAVSLDISPTATSSDGTIATVAKTSIL